MNINMDMNMNTNKNTNNMNTNTSTNTNTNTNMNMKEYITFQSWGRPFLKSLRFYVPGRNFLCSVLGIKFCAFILPCSLIFCAPQIFALVLSCSLIFCICASLSINGQDMTARTGQSGQDRQNRTSRTGQAEQARQNRAGRTGYA
jgi:hypothetical protein